MASYTYGTLTIPVTADTKALAAQISGAAQQGGSQAAGTLSSSMTNGLRAAGGFLSSVGKAAGTAIAGGTAAATAFGVEAFKTAARAGEMDASLRALAKANNVSYDSMQEVVSAVRGQGIEMGTAQTLVAQFTRNQLDLSKATGLATVAQDAAVISGRNSTEVLDDLVHGITTQNTQVLRNAGLNVQAGKAIDDYAKSVGKSTKDLTESERAQAVLNAVLKEGSSVAGAYAGAMQEPGKVLRSFRRVVDDIKLSVGQGLLKAFGPLILQAYDLAKALSAAVAPGGALAPIFDAIGVAVAKLISPLIGLVTQWTEWLKNLKPEQVQNITKIIERFGPVILAAAGALTAMLAPQILGGIPILGGVLKNLTGPIQMATSGIIKLGGSALSAIPGLSSMGGAAGLLPAALNPVGAVVVGIAAAIGVLLVASSDFREGVISLGKALWTGLQPALSAVWDAVKVFGASLWEIVKAIGDALGPALKNLSPLVEQLGKLFGLNLAGGAEGAGGAMESIVPAIVGVIKVIGFLLDVTTKVLVPIIEIPLKLMVLAQQAMNAIHPLKLIAAAIEWLTETAIKLWHWITGNSPGLIPALGSLSAAASAVAGVLSGPVSAAFNGLVSVVQSAHSAISGAVSGAWSQIRSTITSTMSQIQSAVSSGFHSMVGVAQSAGSSMIEGLKSGLSAAKGLGGWMGSNVTGPVTGFIKSGLGIGSPSYITIDFGHGLIHGLQQGLEAARNLGGWMGSNVTGPVVGWLKSGLGIGSPSSITIVFGEEMIQGLMKGLEMAKQAGGWIQDNVAGPIISTLKGALGIGSPSKLTVTIGEELVAGLFRGLEGAKDLGRQLFSMLPKGLADVLTSGGELSVNIPAGGLGALAQRATELLSPLGGAAPGLAGLGTTGTTINVYPQPGQSETEIAAAVSRRLGWAVAAGRA